MRTLAYLTSDETWKVVQMMVDELGIELIRMMDGAGRMRASARVAAAAKTGGNAQVNLPILSSDGA